MKYKVGDEVRIKGTDIGGTVESIIRGQLIVETKGSKIPVWPEEVVLIEGLVKEEIPLDKAGQITDFEYDGLAYSLPEGYIFKDGNGNVINATKIVLEKKKKEYPKTYKECCDVLGLNTMDNDAQGYKWELIIRFQELLIARDAYWKIAGEEMGLGKPWEPDWNTSVPKYVIACTCYGIEKQCETTYCKGFAFPTEEMRDAFKENFGPDIEFCKELL